MDEDAPPVGKLTVAEGDRTAFSRCVQGERAAAGGASQQQEVACFSVAQVHVLLAECARNPDRCRFPALMTASSAPAGPRSFRLQASRIAPEGPQGGGGDDRVVTVTVCEMNFAEGCLGWRVWCCALILADWLLCTPAICRGHTVLELGSGLGLPGMLAAKLGAKAVSLTDCLPLMLKSLHRVVRDNGLAKTTSVHTLDWVTDSGADSQKCSARFGSSAETNEALQQREQEAAGEAWPHLPIGQQFELVMGSDVMYETHHIECLVAVLASRCAVGSRCIFVNPVREDGLLEPGGTLETFGKHALAAGFRGRIFLPPGGGNEAGRKISLREYCVSDANRRAKMLGVGNWGYYLLRVQRVAIIAAAPEPEPEPKPKLKVEQPGLGPAA